VIVTMPSQMSLISGGETKKVYEARRAPNSEAAYSRSDCLTSAHITHEASDGPQYDSQVAPY
jgi:hypothetical protein